MAEWLYALIGIEIGSAVQSAVAVIRLLLRRTRLPAELANVRTRSQLLESLSRREVINRFTRRSGGVWA